MKFLSYSPSVEAYVESMSPNGAVYYDLTKDIVSASVDRHDMGTSTFSITLANENWKYNGVFTPMDKIVIYCTKTDRHKLLSGFITDCDVFSLYQSDLKLRGQCTLYRIHQLYWDPGLPESYRLLYETRNTNENWGGFGETITNLLTKVGGWPEDKIFIGEIPNEAVEFAQEMYLRGKESSDEIRSRVNEFYNILQTHGPKLSGGVGGVGGSGGATQRAVCELYASWEGKFAYSQAGGRLDPVASGYGDCSSTIWRAYKDVTDMDIGTWTGAMVSKGDEVAKGSGTSLPIERMQPADIVLFNWGGYNPSYDHVELYMGDNKFMGHGGPGMGPYWKNDAKAYAGGASDWMVRRFLSGDDASGAGPIGGSISFSDFMSRGIIQGSGETAGYQFSYYSETVLPGYGLNIPGRHVAGGSNGQGYVMDGDGCIVLARPAGGKWNSGDTLNTPFGKGRFYDYCPEGRIDVYVHYP